MTDLRREQLINDLRLYERHGYAWMGEVADMLAAELVVSRELLESLVEDGDCRFDHHDGCQEHGYLSLEPGEKCPQQELKNLLRREDSGHNPVPQEPHVGDPANA